MASDPRQILQKDRILLPVLWRDRFIGRIDPHMDKGSRKLIIDSVHAEPDAPTDKEISSKIGRTIERLAEFLGANEVVYTDRVPAFWQNSLR